MPLQLPVGLLVAPHSLLDDKGKAVLWPVIRFHRGSSR